MSPRFAAAGASHQMMPFDSKHQQYPSMLSSAAMDESQQRLHQCPVCPFPIGKLRAEEVVEHGRAFHVPPEMMWQCGQCEYKSIELDRVNTHCLFLSHRPGSIKIVAEPMLSYLQKFADAAGVSNDEPMIIAKVQVVDHEEDARYNSTPEAVVIDKVVRHYEQQFYSASNVRKGAVEDSINEVARVDHSIITQKSDNESIITTTSSSNIAALPTKTDDQSKTIPTPPAATVTATTALSDEMMTPITVDKTRPAINGETTIEMEDDLDGVESQQASAAQQEIHSAPRKRQSSPEPPTPVKKTRRSRSMTPATPPPSPKFSAAVETHVVVPPSIQAQLTAASSSAESETETISHQSAETEATEAESHKQPKPSKNKSEDQEEETEQDGNRTFDVIDKSVTVDEQIDSANKSESETDATIRDEKESDAGYFDGDDEPAGVKDEPENDKKSSTGTNDDVVDNDDTSKTNDPPQSSSAFCANAEVDQLTISAAPANSAVDALSDESNDDDVGDDNDGDELDDEPPMASSTQKSVISEAAAAATSAMTSDLLRRESAMFYTADSEQMNEKLSKIFPENVGEGEEEGEVKSEDDDDDDILSRSSSSSTSSSTLSKQQHNRMSPPKSIISPMKVQQDDQHEATKDEDINGADESADESSSTATHAQKKTDDDVAAGGEEESTSSSMDEESVSKRKTVTVGGEKLMEQLQQSESNEEPVEDRIDEVSNEKDELHQNIDEKHETTTVEPVCKDETNETDQKKEHGLEAPLKHSPQDKPIVSKNEFAELEKSEKDPEMMDTSLTNADAASQNNDSVQQQDVDASSSSMAASEHESTQNDRTDITNNMTADTCESSEFANNNDQSALSSVPSNINMDTTNDNSIFTLSLILAASHSTPSLDADGSTTTTTETGVHGVNEVEDGKEQQQQTLTNEQQHQHLGGDSSKADDEAQTGGESLSSVENESTAAADPAPAPNNTKRRRVSSERDCDQLPSITTSPSYEVEDGDNEAGVCSLTKEAAHDHHKSPTSKVTTSIISSSKASTNGEAENQFGTNKASGEDEEQRQQQQPPSPPALFNPPTSAVAAAPALPSAGKKSLKSPAMFNNHKSVASTAAKLSTAPTIAGVQNEGPKSVGGGRPSASSHPLMEPGDEIGSDQLDRMFMMDKVKKSAPKNRKKTDKDVTCQMCKVSFVGRTARNGPPQQQKLISHILNYHIRPNFGCSDCSSLATTQKLMKNHISKTHPKSTAKLLTIFSEEILARKVNAHLTTAFSNQL